MKAIICRDYGPIENLEYGDFDVPEVGPNSVLIKTEVMGVNYPDGLLVQGLYQAKPQTPFVPGTEAVGEAIEVGAEVKRFKVGDRVAAFCPTGGYAEQVSVNQHRVIPLPPGIDGADTTALMCGYGTSHHALKQRAQLKQGENLVVLGAAGLTGLAAIQIGKAMGARVIGVASSKRKRKIAAASGADVTLGYDNLKDEIRTNTGGNGADVVYDVVGGEAFDACSRAMAWNGRLLVVGFASGTIPKFPVNLALVKGYSLVGVFWGTFTQKEPAAYMLNMQELFGWYRDGKVKPLIEEKHKLKDAAKVLQRIHSRKAVGKIVLVP